MKEATRTIGSVLDAGQPMLRLQGGVGPNQDFEMTGGSYKHTHQDESQTGVFGRQVCEVLPEIENQTIKPDMLYYNRQSLGGLDRSVVLNIPYLNRF